jgi:uncharacterized protein (DUF302 family)
MGMGYYMTKIVSASHEEAVTRTIEALKQQGFGVLTEINVQETLKKKLGVDFRKYRILGACNAPFAYKALQAEAHVGVLMPCNVIVQELPDGRVEVSTIDPTMSMEATGNAALAPHAAAIREKLAAVLANL